MLYAYKAKWDFRRSYISSLSQSQGLGGGGEESSPDVTIVSTQSGCMHPQSTMCQGGNTKTPPYLILRESDERADDDADALRRYRRQLVA